MARIRVLVSVATVALMPACLAFADPVTVLPTVDHAKAQPHVAVDSTGADATDTTNHAVKVNCVAGCSAAGGGAMAQGAGAAATPWYVVPVGSTGNQASVNASGQIAIAGPVSQSGAWSVALTGSMPALAAGSNTIGSIANSAFGATQSGIWTVQPGNTANTTPWLVSLAGTNSSVPVTGTFWQATQPVSLTSLPALSAGSNVIGAVTQSGTWNIGAVSTLPSLPAGSALIGSVTTDNVADALTTNASVTSATTVTSGSTQGFNGGSFQITSIGTSNTITFEQSNDNTTWVGLNVWGNAVTAGPVSTATAVGTYSFATSAAFVRARVSTYTSGTVTIYQTLKRGAASPAMSLNAGSQSIGTLAASTNLVGDIGVQYRANATGAASVASILSPATPAGASIKASAGRVAGWTLTNSAAAVRSVKFYNATAVTMGTTAAVFEVDIPAGGTVQISLPGGIGFSTGIMWSVTAGKGLTDNTGGVSANDVSGVVFFA